MESEERFEAIDALVASRASLPVPSERQRLRKAHGLTVAEVAEALGVRRATVSDWEAGKREPRPPERNAYARLLRQLAELYPAPPAPSEAGTASAHAMFTPAAPASVPTSAVVESTPASSTRTPRRPAAKKAARKKPASGPASAEGSRYADGPLAVLDGEGHAHGVGGQLLSCPAGSVVELVEWTLQQTRIGASRLHEHGWDADPLLVLTPAAAARLGLPGQAPDVPSTDGGPRLRRLPDDHPVLSQLVTAGWQLTRRGFGPWARIYRPAVRERRQCVQLCLPGWGALEERAWGPLAAAAAQDQVPAPELARILGAYASRVLTPRGSTAVAGLELMTALRPPTRPVRGEDGDWVKEIRPDSLGEEPLEPAPPEAPFGHPLVGARDEAPDVAVNEEAYDWARDPETLSDAECAMPWAVGLDVNCAFLAAANRLTVGLGAPEHVQRPQFDKRLPGSWLVDLSHIHVDERLPSPFTPDGTRPTGPAWYATPTVAYAAELGADIAPLEAWVRPHKGAYLDPWYQRLRDAYMTTMQQLGVTDDMTPQQYLEAMAHHKDGDPGEVAVLGAIKATVKGGLGKLRERAAGRGWRPGQPWSALQRPTWRPDIRAAVIAQARTAMHRKMRNMAHHGLYPLAVLSDCVVYPAAGPSPLDLLPTGPDGQPLTKGVFALGPSPGRIKHEGSRPLLWAAELLDQGGNPANHIKGSDAVAEGE
ncbi:telomere-associated protein Tap [Streptomyces sulphureus]|uniref:telomere-associated protein Tap n=1 Tax=Streptomyces sulphureus TaxID=47758 RepID=UPI000475B462|nr:helix-turn-helix transcriptional regulator [Streptomyces sulphureus]